ncbi:hypothetical protein IGI04_030566 [Brassica rapa subsp. trilocularis]|uniref:RRM domain-containing protein n=1 Tax=Brassica rapa subsp. trilocularis TaxID=1813537 RepID=A0ABQ7LR33_BRACM|nr:hypothetical protein IGI04_030566 [Brassica rapa subsp. trilocularis]
MGPRWPIIQPTAKSRRRKTKTPSRSEGVSNHKEQSLATKMVQPRFVRPSPSSPSSGTGEPNSSNLYVANCGPAVGLSHDAIAAVFSAFGEVKGVYPADESGVRVIVSFADPFSAKSALEALSGRPCPDLDGRTLHIRYSVLQLPSQTQVNECVPVSLSDSDLNIPGLFLLPDFVTAEEEQQLLAAVDTQPWIGLAKRRVQHYGYEFCYGTRNVDTKNRLGELPPFVSPILQRISLFPNLDYDPASLNLDQLTVNEYPSGVGLSPHIDTHSAFEDCIFSLSLAGPCIMEFRRYSASTWKAASITNDDNEKQDSSTCIKKALYLPPRSMLLLSGEARYAWNHYIPHHKIDKVKDKVIRRSPRRVSFTLRKVRNHPCSCRASRKILSKRMTTAMDPKVRKFESVEGADLNSISKPDGIRFRLVSYNILAQEVDEYDSFYRKNMESLGYSGIYIQRTGQRKRDGCAIFYKPSCAELVTKERIEYNDLLDEQKIETSNEAKGDDKEAKEHSGKDSHDLNDPQVRLKRDCVGIMAAFRINKPFHHMVIVANTHLYWDPELADVKLAQAKYLLSRLAQFKTLISDEFECTPSLLLAGDFNSIPGDMVYSYLVSGYKKPAETIEEEEVAPIPMCSVYEVTRGEPKFTNCTPGFTNTLDYIFFSPSDFIKPVSILQLPEPESPDVVGFLPNDHHPSDHLPIGAEFEISRE